MTYFPDFEAINFKKKIANTTNKIQRELLLEEELDKYSMQNLAIERDLFFNKEKKIKCMNTFKRFFEDDESISLATCCDCSTDFQKVKDSKDEIQNVYNGLVAKLEPEDDVRNLENKLSNYEIEGMKNKEENSIEYQKYQFLIHLQSSKKENKRVTTDNYVSKSGIGKDRVYSIVKDLTKKGLINSKVISSEGNSIINIELDGEVFIEKFENSKTKNSIVKQTVNSDSNEVFIVHGHDKSAKLEVARVVESLSLKPIILHEQVNKGKTIIEKFENNASNACFAIVLMTPDDVGYTKGHEGEAKGRARQNVILELGYFYGALGREYVVVLHKGEIEIPTDFLGIVYIKMDSLGKWKYDLVKEMREAGFKVSADDLN